MTFWGPRPGWRRFAPSGRGQRWVACAALILLTLLVACTERETDDVPLTMTGWVSSPAEDDLVREVLQDFRERYPDIAVDYNPIQANYIEKIQLMLGTGTAPDVFMLDAFWAPPLIRYDTLMPLDGFIASADGFDLDDFEPAFVNAFRRGSRLYGLPKDYSTLVLFYNPQMFEAAGLTGPPRSWPQFEEAARRLTRDTDGDGRIDQFGFGLVDGLEYVLPFIWQNDAVFVLPDGTPNIDDPAVHEALAFLQRLRRRGWAKLPSELGAAWNMDGFGRQRVAMTFSGQWALNFMSTTFPKTPFTVAPMPRGKVERSIAYVVGYVMPKSVRRPNRAWKLIEYLTSKEGQRKWAELNIGLPPRRSVVEARNSNESPDTSVFTRTASIARTWQLGHNQRVLDEMQTALQAIYISDVEIQEAMDRLRQRLRRVGGRR